MKKNFLCIIYDKDTSETLAEYEISADDWYYARHQAANKFREDFPEKKFDKGWKVDSLEL